MAPFYCESVLKNKKLNAQAMVSGFGGGPGQNRTADTRIFGSLAESSDGKQGLDIVAYLFELSGRNFGLELCVTLAPIQRLNLIG